MTSWSKNILHFLLDPYKDPYVIILYKNYDQYVLSCEIPVNLTFIRYFMLILLILLQSLSLANYESF